MLLHPFLLRDQVLHTNVGAGNHNYLKTGDHFPHLLSKLDTLCLLLQILPSPSPPVSVPRTLTSVDHISRLPFSLTSRQVKPVGSNGRRSEGERGKGLVFSMWSCGCHPAGKTTALAKQPCPIARSSSFYSQLSSCSFFPTSGSSPQ